MYCSECGKEIKIGSKFCENCGAKIIYKPDEIADRGFQNGNSIKKSKVPILNGIIIIFVIVFVIIIMLTVGKKDKEDSEALDNNIHNPEGIEALDCDLYNPEDIEALAPESAEEYDAYFDILEYYATGEAPEESDWAEEYYESFSEIELEDDSGTQIADVLSTSENAGIMDFEWFHDVIDFNGTTGAGIVVDASNAELITGDGKSLNGGWKAYIYDDDTERFLNAEIDINGNAFAITLNWKYLYLDGSTYDETDSSSYSGTWNPEQGAAKGQSIDGEVEITAFYLSNDQLHEYAIGIYYWPSGEIGHIGLMR